MASSSPRRRLPTKPSEEHLKKRAKRRAREDGTPLATAQRELARAYGFASWPKLMLHVRSLVGVAKQPHADSANDAALQAASASDAPALERMLTAAGASETHDDQGRTLLSLVCRSTAPETDRITSAKVLIDAGARVRAFDKTGATALHWAAERGPLALVELLIKSGIPEWQEDSRHRKPIDYARAGSASDRDRIVETLDRPVIRDPAFKKAVAAVQSGNLRSLRRLLKAHPNLVHDRAIEPDCYSRDYFRNPKLLWFVANNPNLIKTMPANTLQLARAILDVGAEQADIDYTFGLVMTCRPAREQGFQRPLIKLLIERGAQIQGGEFLGALGHGERDAVSAVLETGVPVTVSTAAGLGRIDDLKRLLPTATADQKHTALSMAVLNDELEAARLCLEAGADVNRLCATHQHSTPLHQAATHGNVPMLKLLVEYSARLDAVDTMWNGTPLGWAIHTDQPAAAAYLRSVQSRPG